jgi:hypothetical protein
MLMDSKHGDLRGLSYLLRNKNLWPEKFEWNYASCDNCAMGLAMKSGLTNYSNGLDDKTRSHFFMNMLGGNPSTPGAQSITPEIVADRIDAYLEKV